MDVTLYPDEDWTVDVVLCRDLSAITLTAPSESQSVRIETTYKVLAEIVRRWAHELGVEAEDDGRYPLDPKSDEAYERANRIASDTAAELAKVMGPKVVSAPYKTRTTTMDEIDQKIDNLETLLNEHRKGEERRYPDDFQKGDWVQFPPSKVWRLIDHVAEDVLNHNRTVIYKFGGVDYPQQVRAQTRYPYCTAAQFAEVCDR